MMKKTLKRTFSFVLTLMFLLGFTTLSSFETIRFDNINAAYANEELNVDEGGGESGDESGNGTEKTLDEIYDEIRAKIAIYELKLESFEEAKVTYENAKYIYEELEVEYNAAIEAYLKIADEYENGKVGVKYSDVKEAHEAFVITHNNANEALIAAQELLDTAVALLESLSELYNEITALVETADGEFCEAMKHYKEAIEEYRAAMQQYKQEKKEYREKKAAYKQAMREYEEAMAEYLDKLADWENEKALYDAMGTGMAFTPGSKLLENNTGTADISSYVPKNASANGNKGKINPNSGRVTLANGLYVITKNGSNQWIIEVEEAALKIEFILWAHGNTGKEFIKVTFYDTGEYNIGNDNGMNHLYLVASGVNPGEKPEKPDNKPNKDFGKFPGPRPELTDKKPIKIKFGLIEVEIWTDELGNIIWVELIEEKTTGGEPGDPSDPGGSGNTDNPGNPGGSTGRGITSTGDSSSSSRDAPVELVRTAILPDTTIIDTNVPLAFEPVFEVTEEVLPLAHMPKTDANSDLIPWVTGLLVSMAMTFILLTRINRTRREILYRTR